MTKPQNVDTLLYTPVEAAHSLGVSRSTVYVLIASGELPSVRIGASRRIPVEGLRRYVELLNYGKGGITYGKGGGAARTAPTPAKDQPALWE